ncbi:hypothetical protein [Pseudofrankia inefficax]|uniref:Uncharacterized protein n=1 Tax=Pseudofrankia inefficax (strain DSM 45817 / CECT 9037 / DDB 130130 / EuI1c) TaxID=298654 RepID=E3J6G0_PSEI1|nr:hypothetical protein [Pseudofrankia inefficax]ADP80736.1 hypothetical protein FraEuI1c_2705 [Pseudofrankia inefficax]
MTAPTGFDAAREVADAVLYEGYLLYPYHSGALKNQVRWQFGVLVPPAVAAADGEHATCRTECLLEHLPSAGAGLACHGEPGSPHWATELGTVHVRTRFLHAVERTVWARQGATFVPAELVATARGDLRADQEATPREEDTLVPLAGLLGRSPAEPASPAEPEAWIVPLTAPAGRDVEPADAHTDPAGPRVFTPPAAGREPTGRVVRARHRLDAELRLTARWLPGPYRVARLTAELRNVSSWSPPPASPEQPGGDRAAARDAALGRSLIAAHLVLSAPGWRFLSLTEPPEWAATYAADCRNERAWPVLIGGGGGTGCADTVLAAPIILPDNPRVAQESVGPFFDATEIDEMLTLRTQTLTDEEKALARSTDPRAADLLDRADHLAPELLERLHGAVREVRPAGPGSDPRTPGEPTAGAADLPSWDPRADDRAAATDEPVLIDGVAVSAGSKVRLNPAATSADAQDMFLTGRVATVAAVLRDLDGATHVAVTLDDDPAADLAAAVGRYRYFAPGELVPLGGAEHGEARP